jgi:hypothetical protein
VALFSKAQVGAKMLNTCVTCNDVLPMEKFIVDRDTFSENCPLCVIELKKAKSLGGGE